MAKTKAASKAGEKPGGRKTKGRSVSSSKAAAGPEASEGALSDEAAPAQGAAAGRAGNAQGEGGPAPVIQPDPSKWPAQAIELRQAGELHPYENNPNTHSEEQVEQIARSMQEWGWTMPILIDDSDVVIAGHGRLLAAAQLGISEVPTMVARGWSAAQKRAYVIADNQLAMNSSWDKDLLGGEIEALSELSFDVDLLGFDGDALGTLVSGYRRGVLTDEEERPTASLSERFGVVPFSVINAREGWWQERKRAWLALGIKSALGRDDNLIGYSDTVKIESVGNSSIFDPVLCEMVCRWFCPPGGRVLDPFAGGSVRGVVAAKLGMRYTGVDLSAEQVAENEKQAAELAVLRSEVEAL